MALFGVARLFWISLIIAFITIILDILCFITAHWIVALPQYNNKFKNIGLWEACFNG